MRPLSRSLLVYGKQARLSKLKLPVIGFDRQEFESVIDNGDSILDTNLFTKV
ncbi:hypothetical protein BX616_006321, partial [Lobosporangium transversale]